MTLRGRELVSHSSPLSVAGDGDAGCKYIELSVLVLVGNGVVNTADGLLLDCAWSAEQVKAGLLSERGEPAAVEGA